ncbi:thioredoxin domain-containing protein [Microbacterium phyllosphaerae]|uniref:thioredoxin domain-containing protein n=1 Tax=Microbacterium phyllosphaerae TaxID=124798 RepID=UPI003D65C33A
MTNRLADTLSPYLRAHADNPVDWYPWGPEAFAEAQRRDVPLLISIGYSTCHWCHVMARESFADPATAALINRDFVAIKVDREEHPDVDGAYMAAASAFTQNLGWPLTVFTTPRGRTFYAGTYWPPEARQPMPAFRDVLAAVQEAWTLRRAQAEESADAVTEALARAASSTPSDLPDAAALAAAVGTIAQREDTLFGGFGGAPKFPVATTLGLLQTPLVRREAPDAAAAAGRALAAMSASDLRDVDGGFFRYATQRDWTVPHYERMLTDNAQLLLVALDAGDEPTARGVAAFLVGTLRREGGGFGAAQDSESWIDGQRSEGGYYLRPASERAGLEPPAVDGKVITGWNGLAITALARAGAALAESSWVQAAVDAAECVLRVNRDSTGALVRASLDGVPSGAVATTADVALLAEGLFALAAATGEAAWAVEARELLDTAIEGLDGDPLLAAHGIAASPDQTDGDLPSDAAAVAIAALSAWRFGAGDRYREAAVERVRAHAAQAVSQPFAHGSLLRVAAGLVDPPRQIVVVTEAPEGALASAARTADADVIVIVTPAQARRFADAGFELFEGKDGFDGSGSRGEQAFDCRSFVCRLPVSDPADLLPAR